MTANYLRWSIKDARVYGHDHGREVEGGFGRTRSFSEEGKLRKTIKAMKVWDRR